MLYKHHYGFNTD